MGQADYGPTPPRLVPRADLSTYPISPDGGTLKSFDSEKLTNAVFSDAALHNLARTPIREDICVEIDVYVEAYDPAAPGRTASGKVTLQAGRVGAAAPTLVGTPLMLTYTPNVAPWVAPTVDAQVLTDPVTFEVFVQVLGLAGVPIRWRAEITVKGGQTQETTV